MNIAPSSTPNRKPATRHEPQATDEVNLETAHLSPHNKKAQLVLLIGLLMLTGCLPSSCRRDEDRALFPSDSLSRQIAEQTPIDTLRLAWSASGAEGTTMEHPRTVYFGKDGRIYVSDVERSSIFVFEDDGTFVEERTSEALEVPYLAGLRGDTLLVFSPEARRVDLLVGETVVHSVAMPGDVPETVLQYTTATDSSLYYKAIAAEIESFVAEVGREGTMRRRVPLPGPYWQHAGFLRAWSDSLISLSGYRPVVHVITAGRRVDTMALVGFDSPMLGRSRSFILGDVHQPPLLSASAAPAGALLFVLNVRPGWLRIDTFDHRGRLQHRLVQNDPGYNRNFYPVDLAVRKLEESRYEIAVITTEPEPRLHLYRWP